MKAIRVHAAGGPEALRYEDIPQPAPEAGQVLVKIEAAGVNFIDVYQRTGQYKVAVPFTPGLEAAGVVTAIGSGVTEPRVGDRVAYTGEAGADEVILYTEQDFEAEVKRLTSGTGVQVVYDSVGKTTFDKGLNCLALRGMMVLYGQSSGPVGPLDPQVLNSKGSLFLTRPTLAHHITTRSELLERAGEVLGWISTGKLKLRIGAEFALRDAGGAHRQLEARRTTGKVLLVP